MRQLVRFSRALLSAPGTSKHSGRFLSASVANAENDKRDPEFVKKMELLLPSNEFKKSLNGLQAKQLNSIIPEVELFMYMAEMVPNSMVDRDWQRLLELDSVKKRVSFLEHISLIHHRMKKDEIKHEARIANRAAALAEAKEKHESGAMAYGFDYNSPVMSPFRNQKHINHIEGSRYWKAMRMNSPKVIFDLQYMPIMELRDQKVLGRHMQYVISENFHSNTALQLGFANVPKEKQQKEWLAQTIGYYSREHIHQCLLPEFTESPVKSLLDNTKNVIYISRHAREYISGPIEEGTVFVAATSMDYQRESLTAARKAKIVPKRLPLHYVKWVSGPQYIPFAVLMKILREVYINGGKWKPALEQNIAKRHFTSAEEREAQRQHVSRRRLRAQTHSDLVSTIKEATGNQ